MLLGKEQNLIGHRPERVREVAEAHLNAYGPGDIDILMKSVSPRGGVWGGLAPPDGAVLMRTVEEVRSSYTKLLGAVSVGASQKFISVCTDWYIFMDGVTTVTDKASGRVVESRSVTLFGNDELGTAVDMAWPFGMNLAPPSGQAEADAAARTSSQTLKAHKRRWAGWAAGDADEASQGVAEQCLLFFPCFDPDDDRLAILIRGRAEYRACLADLFERRRPSAPRPSNTVVQDRYVFSEQALALSDVDVRFALVEILNEAGEVQGMLGFATRH